MEFWWRDTQKIKKRENERNDGCPIQHYRDRPNRIKMIEIVQIFEEDGE